MGPFHASRHDAFRAHRGHLGRLSLSRMFGNAAINKRRFRPPKRPGGPRAVRIKTASEHPCFGPKQAPALLLEAGPGLGFRRCADGGETGSHLDL